MRLAILIVSLFLAMTANAQFPSASYPPIKSSSSANGWLKNRNEGQRFPKCWAKPRNRSAELERRMTK